MGSLRQWASRLKRANKESDRGSASGPRFAKVQTEVRGQCCEGSVLRVHAGDLMVEVLGNLDGPSLGHLFETLVQSVGGRR